MNAKSDLAHENRLLHHYVFTAYGNATGRCAYGYPQQSGLICGLCGLDNSDGAPCPRLNETGKPKE